MTEQTDATVTVRHVPERHRYEIRVGTARAGLTAYRDHGDQRVFFHTETDEAYAGQGLASRLVGEALTAVREEGLRVVPVCPYVKKYLTRHEEFADLADPVTPEIVQWLESVLK
ncbi:MULTISPECIES: GNAT family N-acetyltransferase [unclassified Streptomyces]|jgi:predicted GNAT family acetyltransferase|uniref:GNAT family N-acetyltransferase n=1 Tax=unclassified Streptomyces TaxID=2593676 RepID=UPI0037033CCF